MELMRIMFIILFSNKFLCMQMEVERIARNQESKDSEGTFAYNGSTSKCTNSSVSVKSYVSNWTVSGAKAWKSGPTAYASAQGKMKNVLGQTTKTVNKQVSLTCSPSGKLS